MFSLAQALAVGDQHRHEHRSLRSATCAVAAQRSRHDRVRDDRCAMWALRSSRSDRQRRTPQRIRAARRPPDRPPRPLRHEHRHHQERRDGPEQRERRARARTSRRAACGSCPTRAAQESQRFGRSPRPAAAALADVAAHDRAARRRAQTRRDTGTGRTRELTAAGQADSASRSATSGTTTASSPHAKVERRRRSPPGRLSVQDGRDQPQHVHRREHDRDRAEHRPEPSSAWKTPARIRNSPAKFDESGTASAMTPTVISDGRERRPAARHPAEQRELPGRGPAFDHPGEQEQRHRDQSVVDHLQHRAVEAERRCSRTARA